MYGELEDEIPSDLLANLIEVTDKDLKDSVRQDYARRCSKYYQWLVRRLGGAGCHPVDGRPTPLPVKCCPSSKSRKPHPNFLDHSKVNAHFAIFLTSIRKGAKKGEIDMTTSESSGGQRLSHGDVRKHEDALCHHMVVQEVGAILFLLLLLLLLGGERETGARARERCCLKADAVPCCRHAGCCMPPPRYQFQMLSAPASRNSWETTKSVMQKQRRRVRCQRK